MEREGRNGGTLHDFEPGQSGNPNGRPKSYISTYLKDFGDLAKLVFTIEKTDVHGNTTKSTATLATGGQTINQAIAARMLQMALNGDMKAIKEVLQRTEGRVAQPINLGGQKDNPVKVITYMPDNGRRKRPESVSGIPDQNPPIEPA